MNFKAKLKSILLVLPILCMFCTTTTIQSCKSQNSYSKTKRTIVNNSTSGRTNKVLKKASTFLGTQYKYGGNTKKGIDCSGLVCQSFNQVDIQAPRTAREQSEYGVKVKYKNLQPGDIVFFNTSGSGVSHSGIVHHIKDSEVFFIHASSSKGVMISSLENTYWKKRYVSARRYIH